MSDGHETDGEIEASEPSEEANDPSLPETEEEVETVVVITKSEPAPPRRKRQQRVEPIADEGTDAEAAPPPDDPASFEPESEEPVVEAPPAEEKRRKRKSRANAGDEDGQLALDDAPKAEPRPSEPSPLVETALIAAISVVRTAVLAVAGEALPPLPPAAVEETESHFVARIMPVLEGLIFAADHPVTVKELVQILADEGEVLASTTTVALAIERLKIRFSQASGVALHEVAGGYALRTSAVAGRYLRRAHENKPFRMGRAAVETLAILAYRQPVTKAQIDELRGVDSASALKVLLDKQLVRVLGKAEEVGRPLLYGTTKVFLEAFNLKVLSDLPTLREYQELSSENQATVDQQTTATALGRIRDLARPGARIVSEDAEVEGNQAMQELDRALGTATSTTRTAEAVLKAGGKLPPGVDLEKLRGSSPPPAGLDDDEEMPQSPPLPAGAEVADAEEAEPAESLDEEDGNDGDDDDDESE